MTYNWMFDPLGGFVHRCIYSESGVCSAPQCEKGVKCELRPKRDDAPRTIDDMPDPPVLAALDGDA